MARIDWVVVPSIWWENSPLVIQEAFLHGRPVICSDIGGMAEKVADDIDGLHFRRGDAEHLATVMQRAVEAPGLWERLRAGIRPVHRMDDHVVWLSSLYRELMSERPMPHSQTLATVPGN
jgi:glycosyltransferase involved in cell wall biosynthesis